MGLGLGIMKTLRSILFTTTTNPLQGGGTAAPLPAHNGDFGNGTDFEFGFGFGSKIPVQLGSASASTLEKAADRSDWELDNP
jgi:hypothetical protein